MTLTQWHVPIDDFRSYWYAMFTSFGDPVDKDLMRKQRLELYELPDYIPKKGNGITTAIIQRNKFRNLHWHGQRY